MSIPPADLAYVRFPPRWHNVLVPTRPGRAATVGMSLYTASKPVAVVLQQTLWALGRVGGARLLPGARETWTPPMELDAWAGLWAAWTALAGRDPDGAAVYERLQSERAGLTLLLCAGERSMLVRARRDDTRLAAELALSDAVRARPPQHFSVPLVRGHGEVAGWHWVAHEALATRPHLPGYRLAAPAFGEITDLVERVVTRPAATPMHWHGAHGDIVPWNLRRSRGRTWLIDWEEAAWAPPGTDPLHLQAVLAALRPGPVRQVRLAAVHDEARAHLRRVVETRPTSASEQRLRTRLLAALG